MDGRIHLVSSEVKSKFILRFAICSGRTAEKDVDNAWSVIHELATKQDDKIDEGNVNGPGQKS